MIRPSSTTKATLQPPRSAVKVAVEAGKQNKVSEVEGWRFEEFEGDVNMEPDEGVSTSMLYPDNNQNPTNFNAEPPVAFNLPSN